MGNNNLEKLFAEQTIRQQDNYYRLAYSYTKNSEDALDIIQDSIYKALSSLDTLVNPDVMKTWFYRILVNTSLDFLRKNRNGLIINDDLIEDKLGEIPLYPDIDLQRSLEELPLNYRSVIVLRYFEDLKIDEIAAILNLNPNTVKTRLYTALKLLRQEMQE